MVEHAVDGVHQPAKEAVVDGLCQRVARGDGLGLLEVDQELLSTVGEMRAGQTKGERGTGIRRGASAPRDHGARRQQLAQDVAGHAQQLSCNRELPLVLHLALVALACAHNGQQRPRTDSNRTNILPVG